MKCLLSLALFAGVVLPIAAQDDKVAGQKANVTASLTKAGLKKLTSAETKNILVISSLSESRAKSIAESAQKVFAFTQKALKLDDMLWPGKLTLVALGDDREFSAFVRVVTQMRPNSKDWYTINVRGDVPTAAVFVEVGAKAKDSELTVPTSTIVAAALLNKKIGTGSTTGSLPEWVQLGFGKLMQVKTVGGATLTDYRTKSKAAVFGTKSRPAPSRLEHVTGGVKSKDFELLAASVVEYMLYGVEGDKFLAFAAGFKPNEMVAEPTLESAFMGVEWKMDAFEVGWKIWHSKQK